VYGSLNHVERLCISLLFDAAFLARFAKKGKEPKNLFVYTLNELIIAMKRMQHFGFESGIILRRGNLGSGKEVSGVHTLLLLVL